jgi:hypothetical protein
MYVPDATQSQDQGPPGGRGDVVVTGGGGGDSFCFFKWSVPYTVYTICKNSLCFMLIYMCFFLCESYTSIKI